ncbi:hypothetical protein BX616_005523 [Lobosporangium transversale]|uniref:Uncharacterized protein n=1 Tax=Lobosporangium transversale TaxID=64571 RepID=A0A1Y2GPA6_9FUNG|nr:hypothetical protein BCR41DRAFT_397198 [Lobosporangium transversale]KAF9915730.1 hypothetical protein BX616_005523 [Lobosporangium transversale]ORZ13382.1 hypothetical protein BCR41DRAFT_397198 [Lobosporangium transversale]|eukprot:XP_021880463.1 hypothetical protein BCR41DRAFT_397198 [Lobosporangium transversale]
MLEYIRIACTSVPICAPAPGESWTQDSLESIIWNPLMTAPFNQYERVDIYIVDDANATRTLLVHKAVDLNLGMTAVRLEAPFFPEDAPVNRSCHILMIRARYPPDGNYETLNSSTFFMIRTKQTVNGTTVPIQATATSTGSLPTTQLTGTLTYVTTQPTNIVATENIPGSGAVLPTLPILPADSTKESNGLSPLVIGLISAGVLVLLIAIVAIGLLLRTRKRFKGDPSYFKNLYDQPSSPTDDASKKYIFKDEGDKSMTSSGSFVNPTIGIALATGRNSANTVRSADPVIKVAPGILGHNNQESSPTTYLPLVERKSPILHLEPFQEIPATVTITTGEQRADAVSDSAEKAPSRAAKGSTLSAGDAQLIAETFRKSMRRPRWEDPEEELEEVEQDEARRAANELLRKELSEQGLDVQRGVQRRVTIQNRPHRSSVPPPISESVSIPEP